MPRRIADSLRRIVAMQPRLAAGKPGRFARTDLMALALDVLEIDFMARGKSTDMVWNLRDASGATAHAAPPPPRGGGPGRQGGPPRRSRAPRHSPR
ncbi:MAG: hypothetical protein U0169_11165 [Polyangiaceae bacterium]